MADKQENHKEKSSAEPVEAICPKCGQTVIFYLHREPMPKCQICKIEMVIRELLDEGKSY